jgi:hypothetical protein
MISFDIDDTGLTEIEKGIIVRISPFELMSLESKKGYLSYEAYPPR